MLSGLVLVQQLSDNSRTSPGPSPSWKGKKIRLDWTLKPYSCPRWANVARHNGDKEVHYNNGMCLDEVGYYSWNTVWGFWDVWNVWASNIYDHLVCLEDFGELKCLRCPTLWLSKLYRCLEKSEKSKMSKMSDTNGLNYLGFLKESGESEVSKMSDTLTVWTI